MPEDDRYTLTELADLAGVTPRTVRYYLAQGLLPSVGQTGPGSKYDADHLARLRLIRRLQAEHLPLAEIRRRLDALDDDEIRDLAGSGGPPPPTGSALDYLRSVLGPAHHGAPGSAELRSVAFAPRPGTAPRQAMPAMRDAAAVVPRPMTGDSPSAPSNAKVAPPTAEPTSPSIERSQWDRIVLAPDIELHIRRPLARAQNKQVDRLVTIARELLEEDRS